MTKNKKLQINIFTKENTINVRLIKEMVFNRVFHLFLIITFSKL
jgi:hypothetical protein